MSISDVTGVQSERMRIRRRVPGVSRAMIALEERAALALADAVSLAAETHGPAEVYEEAGRYLDSDEPAHLTWQIAGLNVRNRFALATRTSVGTYKP